MPLYNSSAFAPLPEVAIPGKPAYLLGSLNIHASDTRLRITSVALSSNVATVTGTIYRGNIPLVGQSISVRGTVTGAGEFNTTATITGVIGNPSTGVYSISYALTGANVASTSDSGEAIIPIAETTEVCANGTSVAVYVPSNELRDLGEKSITVATTFPSLPTAATVQLYSAINNRDAEYTLMGTVATVASGAQTAGPLATFATPAGRFFRVVVSGVSGGTNPTIIAKLVC